MVDGLCNAVWDDGSGQVWWQNQMELFRSETSALLLHSDGASHGNPGAGASAAVLSACLHSQWQVIAYCLRLVGPVTSVMAEMEGMCIGLDLLHAFLEGILVVD